METELFIIGYFVFILGVGVFSWFRVKNPADYFIAGKKGGVPAVSGSLLATILGGSAILGTIELSQKTGWPALWFLLSASFGLFLLIPISAKVRRLGHFTLPELLGRFYGKKAEKMASAVIPVAWLGIVAAQIIAAAKILNGLGSLDYNQAALISSAVFIVYTLIGGQISILKTDMFQSLFILAGLVTLFFFALNDNRMAEMEPLHIRSFFNASFSPVDLLVLILTYSVTFIVGPDIYSRIFCSKNEKTAQKTVWMVALILIPVSFLLTFIGIFSTSFQDESIVSFARHFLPEWGYGLFLAALLSAVMSSADTTLLTSSIILSELYTGDLNHKKSLALTRKFVVGMGLLSLLIALFVNSIIQSLLFALTFFSGAFVVPVLAGLLNFRVNPRNVVAAALTGGVMALSGKIMADSFNVGPGNLLVILAYLFNFMILSHRTRK